MKFLCRNPGSSQGTAGFQSLSQNVDARAYREMRPTDCVPVAGWASLDSERVVPVSPLIEEDSEELLNSAVHQSTSEGPRKCPRCRAVPRACAELHLSSTPEHADKHDNVPPIEVEPRGKASPTSRKFAAAALVQEKAGRTLKLDECTTNSELHGQSIALAQDPRPQPSFTINVVHPSMNTPRARLPSSAAVNGSGEQISEKRLLTEVSEGSPAPESTPATPSLQEQTHDPDEAMHLSPAVEQPPTTGNNCWLPRTRTATQSELEVQEESDYRGEASSSSDFCPDACAHEATPCNRVLYNSGAIVYQDSSSSQYFSQPQTPSMPQAPLHVSSEETTGGPESGLQVQQQHAELVGQGGNSRCAVEQLQYSECNVPISQPPRTSSQHLTITEPCFCAQHATDSYTPQVQTTCQPTDSDAVHPANYSLMVADGWETSGRSPALLAAATLPPEDSVRAFPCWPHSTWPLCSPASLALPTHSLPHLQHLHKHVLPEWQMTLSLPPVYVRNDHNETETISCCNPYGINASTGPVWQDEVNGPKSLCSPGELWQPVQSPYIEGGLQMPLQAGKSLSSGHVPEDCSTNCSSCGRCRIQQWNLSVQPEQGRDSVGCFPEAPTRWLQPAQEEESQTPQADHFHHYDVYGTASGHAYSGEVLINSSNTFHAEGRSTQIDWKRREPQAMSDPQKAPSAKSCSSSVYRRQLLQQLAIRHDLPQTPEAENVFSLVGDEGGETTEVREAGKAPSEGQLPAAPQGLYMEGEAGVSEDWGHSVSASSGVDAAIKASDSLHRRVMAPADPQPSLVAAAEAVPHQSIEGAENCNLQENDRHATHLPRGEVCTNGCTDASSTQQFVHTEGLSSVRPHTQWTVPPPEMAAALTAVRAAAASAAAAIAAEWQQHLAHYLEDCMQQLSPVHQWWLLHLQQPDQLSMTNTPVYAKEWQVTEAGASMGVSAVLTPEARRSASSATLQPVPEQRQQLQSAGEADRCAQSFNEQYQWQPHASTFAKLMYHPASTAWTAVAPCPPTHSAGTLPGPEGAWWEHAPQSGLLRDHQTVHFSLKSPRQRFHALRRSARADRGERGRSTPGEWMQWGSDASCLIHTADPPEAFTSVRSMSPFIPQRPRQQRQLLRGGRRSMVGLSLSERAEGMQVGASRQRSTPNRFKRKCRRAYRGQLAEDYPQEVHICRKPDTRYTLRERCCSTCCGDLTFSSCTYGPINLAASSYASRTNGDCREAVEFPHEQEEEETRQMRSAAGHGEAISESGPREGTKAVEITGTSPAEMHLIESAVKQIKLQTQLNGKEFTTESYCLSCSPRALRGDLSRREPSHGGLPPVDTTLIGERGNCSGVKSDRDTHRQALPRTKPVDCKEALKGTKMKEVAEEATNGTEHRTAELLSTRCSSHTAPTSQTGMPNDKTPASTTNRVSLTRPGLISPCGANCMDGWTRRRAAVAPASTPTLDRWNRCSEELGAAGQYSPFWVRGGKSRTNPAGTKAGDGQAVYCSVTESTGRNSIDATACGRASGVKGETYLAADGKTAEKWPPLRKREIAAEEGSCRAARSSHSGAHVGSLDTEVCTKGAEQSESNETGSARTRRLGRPC